ncbi:MAG: hypothetical protein A2431_01270 [Candidatus Zambryskibacteria bacterium RIFOXYC1_FULL_39_10]|uniref:Uncharacterized protein n=1 Tax=Candidatus Zambryskibacteria bacterium RIFOXYC1_FULL_39_10 TaxID=1802779 RepID=A0A1G2UZ98_9BACT|nr:MAG: hypothetical protein A2431_01270 [Candidatus Zambryskibacteria bacterium RIFOXYC1_FULL_39_10]
MKTIQNDFGIIESITRINAEINRLYAAKELQLKALSTIYPPVDDEATPVPEKKRRGRKAKALGKGIVARTEPIKNDVPFPS